MVKRIYLGVGVLVVFASYYAGRLDGRRAALEPVVERGPDYITLKQGPGAQTISMLDGGGTGLYYDWAALVPVFMTEPTSQPQVLMLGLGGGEMLRVLKRTLPSPNLTAVEIDDRVIVTALRDFPANVENVTVVNADAARFMSKCPTKYDAIIVDVYDGSDMPEHFQSTAFYKDVERCLFPHGMVIVNSKDRALAKVLVESLHSAGFNDVVAFPVSGGSNNIILWAVRRDDWGMVYPPPELQEGFDHRFNP